MLDEIVEDHVGDLLHVEPYWGYGWRESRHTPTGPAEVSIEPPVPFGVRLRRLLSDRGNYIGLLGSVKESRHPLDGWWMISYLRTSGRYNFRNRTGDYNIMLGVDEPFEGHDGLPGFGLDRPGMAGYGKIRLREVDRIRTSYHRCSREGMGGWHASILMERNDQYLCIVPGRGAAIGNAVGKVFLPFEGDERLGVILSKAFLLAEDSKIKDATILNQIGRG